MSVGCETRRNSTAIGTPTAALYQCSGSQVRAIPQWYGRRISSCILITHSMLLFLQLVALSRPSQRAAGTSTRRRHARPISFGACARLFSLVDISVLMGITWLGPSPKTTNAASCGAKGGQFSLTGAYKGAIDVASTSGLVVSAQCASGPSVTSLAISSRAVVSAPQLVEIVRPPVDGP